MQEFRLPWNAREGIIYGCVIAALSSLIIGGYNVYDNMGYTLDTFGDFAARYIVIWPVMFLVAFTLANTVVGWGAKKIVHRYIGPEDSSNAYLCFNLIACVLLMSVILTFLGGLVGETIGYLLGGTPIDVMELIENWPRIWPRNFCIAFWVEMLIAQPAARMVMVRMHKAKMGEITS
ncbi:MAG: DUF2798 domain-containing protein [Thermoplasmata archaeon]|jgi:hypothetical protein|nr:DUF2798 domain-containing protein [Thermoplasmata archaeon]